MGEGWVGVIKPEYQIFLRKPKALLRKIRSVDEAISKY